MGKTETTVKDAVEFVQLIKEKPAEDGTTMISFDVVSLFTKVPIDDALQAISSLLTNDNTLEERTCIPANEICSLIELCLRTTYFQFGEIFYEQVDGAAMGSPLSPIVANLYMEVFESRALTSAPAQLSL